MLTPDAQRIFAGMTQRLIGTPLNSLRAKPALRNPFSEAKPWPSNQSAAAVPEHNATVSWLWEGMLAAGNVTLLTSVWKAGKSSLLALLLAGRREGNVLLGRMVEAGASAVVSEEPAELSRRRGWHLPPSRTRPHRAFQRPGDDGPVLHPATAVFED
jgi:hypothetical protein